VPGAKAECDDHAKAVSHGWYHPARGQSAGDAVSDAGKTGRVKEAFARVYELPPEERASALAELCGDDEEMRSQVEALLRHHDELGPDEPLGKVALEGGGAYESGDRVGDRYRIVSFLGRGGMGEVYRADDLVLGEPVALKFLRTPHPALLEALRSEVHLAHQVSHPTVCRIHDIGEADGRFFLSMEYVPGEDLEKLLRRVGRLAPSKVHELARELCDGLAEAHACGVVHRDLKPSNVMLDANGRARILDFGIAARSQEGAGIPGGTPSYMSPEQLRGAAATERGDLYSLGLVLHEALTGHRQFPGGNMAEISRLHESAPVQSPALAVGDVPAALEDAVMRALEEDPHRRPESATAMCEILDGKTAVRPAVRPTQIRPWLLPAALLLVWVVCLAIHVQGGVAGLRRTVTDILVHSTGQAADYPVFAGFGRPPADPTTLAPGDRITRIGTRDMRGVGAFWLRGVFSPELSEGSRLRVEYLRDGLPGVAELRLATFPSPWWLLLPAIFSWVGVLTWVLARSPRDPRVRATFFMGVCPAIAFCFFGQAGFWRTTLDAARFFLFGGLLGVPLLLRFLSLMPDRRSLSPGARWVWVFGPAMVAAQVVVWLFSEPWAYRVFSVAFPGVIVLATVTGGAIVVQRYRESNPVGRRQLRWVGFGMFAPFPLIALAYVAIAFDPRLYWTGGVAYLTTIATPICLVVGISRYNVFDIDRLISAALGYGVLASAILVLGLVGIPRVVYPLAENLGIPPLALAVPAAVLLVLALLPFQTPVSRRIDRVLFHDRWEADVGIEDLLERLPQLETIGEVYRHAGERLLDAFHARSCAIHGLDGDTFAPHFLGGSAAAASFAKGSPLIGLLQRRQTALASSSSGGVRLFRAMDAFERAALETLDAEVVVPVRRGERLLAFFSLGPKASGDVYTPVDRALLATLARVIAEEIARRSDDVKQHEPSSRHHVYV
jgi:predicted Ser/Thr protein kinase